MSDIRLEKPKITVLEQIKHMQKKGITFKYITEKDAEKYLLEHTYYFKLKAYSKNYERRNIKSKRGNTYICLDFSYLQDLARLDMLFRELIFKMTVDIEHLLKVQLLAESQKNEQDDGYEIVSDFLRDNPDIFNSIQNYSTQEGYSSSLIQKYSPNFPIWVFVEIISFGDLIKFYKYYFGRFCVSNNFSKYLWSARILRNAAAHNACVLNRLKEVFEDSKINNTLMNVLIREYNITDKKQLKQYLKNPVVQDFLVVLVLFKKLNKSNNLLEKRIEDVKAFLHRCRKHATYYRTNNTIFSLFKFIYYFVERYEKKSLTK